MAKSEPKTVPETVRELCLAFPGARETQSHERPDYQVNGSSFATFFVNHHGDGRVALWLRMPPGAQATLTDLDPNAYFVPPYVGHRGWLGVELNKGLSWTEIAARVKTAWEQVAPKELRAKQSGLPDISPPDVEMSPGDINPLLKPRWAQLLESFDEHCMRFPEVVRDEQFGRPVWKAGKKTFAGAFHRFGRLHFDFWVGVEQQGFLTEDERYTIPRYTGHNGWINLDVGSHQNWAEIDGLLDVSYRHFALKRMLKALDDS